MALRWPAGDGLARPRLLLLRTGAVGVALIGWQLAALLVDRPTLLPAATDVLVNLWQRWIADPVAWREGVLPSLARLLAGWSGAVVVGVGAGVLIGLSRPARDTLEPAAAFLRAIPPPAVVPLFIVLLGIGDAMKVTLIGFGVVWPILINTADGVAAVDPLHRDTARVYGVRFVDRLRRVVLPSAAPRILTGMRISLSIAVILMVISEMVATVDGVGFALVQAQRTFRTLDVWSTIVLLGLIGAGLNAVLAALQERVLRRWPRTGAPA